jgi:hypothetical protein
MTYDLKGRAPRSDAGNEFCMNYCGWPDVVRHCISVAPDVCARLKPPTSMI